MGQAHVRSRDTGCRPMLYILKKHFQRYYTFTSLPEVESSRESKKDLPPTSGFKSSKTRLRGEFGRTSLQDIKEFSSYLLNKGWPLINLTMAVLKRKLIMITLYGFKKG